MRTNTAPTNPAARPAASHPAPAEAVVHAVDRHTLRVEHVDQLTVIDARS